MTAVGEAVDTGNLIGGAYRPSTTGRTFESRNPAHTADVVGVFPRSDAADVDSAVAVARAAFESWRRTPWPTRAARSSCARRKFSRSAKRRSRVS